MNYKLARERNLKVNLLATEMAKNRVLDFLILSQDDAKPKGVHIRDREVLTAYVNTNNLQEIVTIQPGADEVSMLLLARSVTDKYNYHPKIKVIFSSEIMADKAMPFEDRPLRKTVSFHIKAVGAVEENDEKQADICFFVFTSRFEAGRAESFAEEINNFAEKKKQGIIITDIDPKGDVQGGDIEFTEALKSVSVFAKIYGFACWNTAGNAIGTALPHGILYGVSRKIAKIYPKKTIISRMNDAQTWFMLNRLLDDYAYHSIVRPMAAKMMQENKWNAYRLTDEQTKVTKELCTRALQPIAEKTVEEFYSKSVKKRLKLSSFTFDLPWNRTFEAEINLTTIPSPTVSGIK